MTMANWDTELLLLLNGDAGLYVDSFMEWLSSRFSSLPVYLGLTYLLYKKYATDVWKILVATAFLILISDQVSVAVKNLVQRERPCHQEHIISQLHQVNHRCGGQYGFYSSHASNTMSLSVLCILLLRTTYVFWGMLLWAISIGYSRIYLGVHFPGDILVGWLAGFLLGLVTWSILKKFIKEKQAV
jgi:undecaprenyl-diphosphatase